MNTPLILLSGLGADERVLAPLKPAFAHLIIPPWIPPMPDESLAHYAARTAHAIDPRRPCFIGGISFGGMLAIEMTHHLEALGCFLIASARRRDELPKRVRWLGSLTARSPAGVVVAASRVASGLSVALRRIACPATLELLYQVKRTDPAFARWAFGAMLNWQASSAPDGVPVWRIHGDCDRLLPLRGEADVLVPGGGHLLPLTHADQVAGFIGERMSSV